MTSLNVGLGGLESYGSRGLSQPTTYDEYKGGNVDKSEDDVASTEDESEFSGDEVVNNPSLEDEIPRHIDPTNVDDDGNPTSNIWVEIY